MNEDKTGGTAFPTLESHGDGRLDLSSPGMTLRDYFAAKALQAILSTETTICQAHVGRAEVAYEIADAMLKARTK